MHSRAPLAFCCAVAACLSSATASAHELWLEASSYRPPPGSVVQFSLWLGERFDGQRVEYVPQRCAELRWLGPAGESPVMSRAGSAPLLARTGPAGSYVLAYRTHRAHSNLDAGRFTKYLEEERLTQIITQRAARGESDQPGREVYSRCAKVILTTPGAGDDRFRRPVGLPLELFMEHDPAGLAAGQSLSVQLLYRGRPLPGARIVAAVKRNPGKLQEATTDDAGRASFAVHDAGPWLITSLHMVRAEGVADAEWESFWASLTFEVPPAESPAASAEARQPPASGR